MLERIKSEPTIITTAVGALLVLLVQLGVPISDGLANAISALVVAVLALFLRSQVTPVTKTEF